VPVLSKHSKNKQSTFSDRLTSDPDYDILRSFFGSKTKLQAIIWVTLVKIKIENETNEALSMTGSIEIKEL